MNEDSTEKLKRGRLGIWETVHNPEFNSGEFAIIKSQAGLNSYKPSVKEWIEKTNAIGLRATAGRYGVIAFICANLCHLRLNTPDMVLLEILEN